MKGRFRIEALAVLFLGGCATLPEPKVAGQGAGGPWWMRETALTRDGRMYLKDKPWWPEAVELGAGESFQIAGTGAGTMLVRREKLRNRSEEVEALVWVIDDDADGSALSGGDRDSDCYVVDYGPDGVVDRMVDYIDTDGDQDPDEMDIRYFSKGELRQVWCGLDLDDDDAMWDLAGYEYSGDFFRSDPSGDGMIYMNKFDPERGEWVPFSECPFAFIDTDDDGFSEIVIRVSAAPLEYDPDRDPDYANDPKRYRGEWSEGMERMGVVNIRCSFDVDGLSGREAPLHYDFGFNLVGDRPYRFPGMDHFNVKRRPPQVIHVIPHGEIQEISDRFEARETGFSWFEHHDDTIAVGAPPSRDLDFRWEGVFWIWERRFMENTGGPTQKWNMRREWSGRTASARELYYSGVDRRIHLKGAEEGWLQMGRFNGLDGLGEVRMYDTDGNGYFDRWEVYLGEDPVPARVTTVPDEKTGPVPLNYRELTRFYAEEVLPEAMEMNARLMAAMVKVHEFSMPEGLRAAMETGSMNHRRYAQDVARELLYQDLRRHLTEAAHGILRRAPKDDLRRLSGEERRFAANTQTAWQMIRLLEKLDVAYGQGDFLRACEILEDIETAQ